MTTNRILLAAVLIPAAMAGAFMPAAMAADAGAENLRAWFKDGTCVEFYSESTGATTPLSMNGSVIVGPSNVVHRVVNDRHGNVLFGYDVVASRGAAKDTFEIQVRPTQHGSSDYVIAVGDEINVRTTQSLQRVRVGQDGKVVLDRFGEFQAAGLQTSELAEALKQSLKPSSGKPLIFVYIARVAGTVKAPRIFPGIRRGEAVKLDILHNPMSDEIIYDVLRPSDEAPPSSAHIVPSTEEFVFGNFQMSINGEKFADESGALLTGGAARIYVPGHGAYYFSLEAAAGFREVGHASRDRLSFSLDGENVEIAAKQNVLKVSTYRPVWVKRDASITSKENRVEVMTADKVEWLLPKKR